MPETRGNTEDGYRQVKLSVGDIVDRLTIAELKLRRLKKSHDLDAIRESAENLRLAVEDVLETPDKRLVDSIRNLADVNEKLWDVEDNCRRDLSYPSIFLKHATDVMRLNRQRSELKAEINKRISGCTLDEIKSYGQEKDSKSEIG